MNTSKKSPLGRGLGALIEGVEKEALEKKVEANLQIEIDAIDGNPFQPRTRFDSQSLEELAASIRQMGIVVPLTVRETGDGRYQLIAGERRLRAARMAGLTHVPAYVRTADDTAMLEMALVENIQREDLDAIEVAITYQRLIEECSLTQEQLSDRVGKQRSTVANYLRLLRLPAEIQLGIRNRNLTMGHARTLVNIEDPARQINVFYHIIEEDLSVRATEDLVRRLQREAAKDPAKIEKKNKLNAEYQELSKQLSNLFQSDVQFRINQKGRGKIVIPFSDSEEMERIIGLLDKLNR
ncbi:MAG TPA: ParB/RepB/Spo0J family partition protein [Bacteroidales bacterium]|jgi:ParB family chromosome partitioning protein|nr:ParB/RepB/Spo0J family partition protein [Bacteroidales bacterium]MDI9533269.1 ParB/RepB/Spo0J family partition protein [Bacteroidota bacterium]OPZ57255.1 MAG: putative chromosome-partitioning protein ParB [Bacteroidetes bacterium ADurb.BinA012]MBK7733316.1 ParB/RepB/Spo0J family partition protein [Bacteroidales bacterium]MBP7036387.1 ParB/RepB/Spo0J family partition protein [Bacteroidales bacterium]